MVEHFDRVARARNKFTHPTRLEYLSPVHAFEDFRQISAWFPAEILRTLYSAARALGLHSPRIVPDPPTLAPGPIFPDPSTILDKTFYDHVFSVPAAAIGYIDRFSQALYRDLARVMSSCSAALTPPLQLQRIGRTVRAAIRTITQTAEGEMGFALFFMRAVRRRNAKVVAPQPIKGETVTSRVARVLAAFSSNFGRDFEPATKGKSWEALNHLFERRDRLIHPRRSNDVDLSVDHLSTAMTALTWLMDNSSAALWLDQTKTAELIGTRSRPISGR